MFSRMLKLPEQVRSRYDLSSLETAVHAAAPCPVPVKQQMIDWWGPVLLEYYASTEAVGFSACDSAEWLAHPGTVGEVVLVHLTVEHGLRRHHRDPERDHRPQPRPVAVT
jgi:long-chain acyl-CoA synthetase